MDRVVVVGSEGMLHFESRTRAVECYDRAGGHTGTFTGPQTATAVAGKCWAYFGTSLERLVAAIRSGEEPDTSARQTQHVLAIQAGVLH